MKRQGLFIPQGHIVVASLEHIPTVVAHVEDSHHSKPRGCTSASRLFKVDDREDSGIDGSIHKGEAEGDEKKNTY